MKTIEIFNSNITINDEFNVIEKDSYGISFQYTSKVFFKQSKGLYIDEINKIKIHLIFHENSLEVTTERYWSMKIITMKPEATYKNIEKFIKVHPEWESIIRNTSTNSIIMFKNYGLQITKTGRVVFGEIRLLENK